MGLVAEFQRRFLAQGTPGPEDDFWYTSPMGLVLPGGGNRVTLLSALRLDTVYACVSLLARTFGSLPLKVYQKFPDGTREERPDHPLYEVLHYQPNETNTAFEFRQWEQVYIELAGNSYAQIVPGARGAVGQLLPLDPYRMTVVRKANGQVVYEFRQPDGRIRPFLPEEIHHIRNMSLDGLTGLSTISVWADVIGYGLLLQEYANRFTRNDARPGGTIEYATSQKPEVKKDLADQWQAMQGGMNRGRVAVLDNGGKFNPISVSNKDAQFIEARNYNVPQVARLFGIPPTKIGWLEKSSYSNVEELNIATVTDAYLPRSVQREQAIRRDLFTPQERADGFFAEYDLNALLRGNLEQRYKAYGIAIERGFLVRNEVRRFENMDPLPGLDKPLVPMNMSVIEDDGSIGQGTGQGSTPPALPGQNAQRWQNNGNNASDPRGSLLAVTAAHSITRSECAAVRRAMTRESGAEPLCAWLEEYYATLPERLVARLGMDGTRARNYSEQHRKMAIETARTRKLGEKLEQWEKSAAGELAGLVLEES
jgi:HK97 family phage portal protein